MSAYYSGWGALNYNTHWRIFTHRTQAAVLSMLDFAVLNDLAAQRTLPLRVCDVACGTGVLLQQLATRLPGCELYGFDASSDMLAQARQLLQAYPSVHLLPHFIGTTTDTMLPPHFHNFDIVTCSNALHDIKNPVGFLQQLGSLLAPGGVLVVEDYARREPIFPWIFIEIFGKFIERGHVRAYTQAEARSLCFQAGLRLDAENSFVVDRLWHGWVLRAGAEMNPAPTAFARKNG